MPTTQLDPRVLAATAEHLPQDGLVACPSHAVAAALRARGWTVSEGPLDRLSDAAVEAVALLDEELGHAGEHAEELLAEAARILTKGGLVLVSAASRLSTDALRRLGTADGSDGPPATASEGPRSFTAEEVHQQLGHRGFAVELLCAPGAASVVATGTDGPYDPELDQQPGLVNAGRRIVAVGRRHPDEESRSAAFFASLPQKVVAAAVLCRDHEGRVLVVHDSFKRHWTIPGGVVDGGEDPATGAVREAREEAGVIVALGDLLGLFSSYPPDRLMAVYSATPEAQPSGGPQPLHAHEIDAVEWVPLATARDRVAPHVRFQLERCLESPGGTWRQPR